MRLMVIGCLALAVSVPPVARHEVQAQQIQIQRVPGDRFGFQRGVSEQKKGTGRIRGRVVGADSGSPLRRAQVTLSSPELRDRRMTATDAQGRFEFKELPASRFILSASKGSYVTMQYGARRPLEPGKPIELADGQELEKMNLQLPRGSVISGRIVDEFGEPIADVVVQAQRYQYMQGQRRLVPVTRPSQSNDIGQFRIYGLPPGSYYVSATLRAMGAFGAESDETTGYAPTYYPGTTNVVEAQRVSVAVGQEQTSVDFALIPARTARISGTAVDSQGKPLANAFVMLIQQEGAFGFSSTGGGRVRPDGTFTLSGVPPGQYTVQVREMPGSPDGSPEFASAAVTVTGEDIDGLSLVATKGATASGQVVFDGGAKPSFAATAMQISAPPATADFGPLGGGFSGRVKEDWTCQITGLTGHRLIRAGGMPSSWTLKAVLLNGEDVTDTGVEFKGGEDVSGLQVVLTNRTTEVDGTVSDRGTPVKEYTAIVFADDSTRWGPRTRFIQVGRPDQDGKFKIRGLPPQSYLAIAVESVQEGEWSDPDFLERAKGNATRFALNEGETKTFDLKLAPSP